MEYKISSGGFTAAVNTRGAELTSFSDGKSEYIWTGDPAFWSGHNPNLFPVIGRMKNGEVAFDGVKHEMSKHGFARGAEFCLTEISADSVSLSQGANEETKKAFPFDFVLTITHKVFPGGFSTKYSVKNTDEKPLVFTVGGHTGINLPALGARSVDGCALIFDSEENATVWYGDENLFVRDDFVRTDVLRGTDRIDLNYPLFDGDALIIGNMRSHSVRLAAPSGRAVEMDFSGFPVLGVWTPPGKKAPFICLEPWHGLPAMTFESGEFSEKPYVITAAPGEEKSLGYSLRIL